MKLTNPTDEQLIEAFAEKVCAWPETESTKLARLMGKSPYPPFTQSFDAVLPWLEKHEWSAERFTNGDGNLVVVVRVGLLGIGGGWCDTELPRAAVIALLRAHDVAVEFSPAT